MKMKWILPACVLAMAIALSGCSQKAPAEEEKDLSAQALQAYREILEAAPAIDSGSAELQDASFGYEENLAKFGNHYELFAISDLNQDNIPEMIALTEVNFRWTPVSVFTYADGQAVLLKDPQDAGVHGTFEQCGTAGGTYYTYICENSHIHSVWSGLTPIGEVEENYAYALTDAALSPVECTVGENDKTIYFSDIAKSNTAENADAIAK